MTITKSMKQNIKYKKNKEKAKKQLELEKKLKKINDEYQKKIEKYQLSVKSRCVRDIENAVSNINYSYEKKLSRWLKKISNRAEKKKREILWKRKLKKHSKTKTKNKLFQELYKLVQKYARLRDSDVYGYWYCISCWKRVHYKKADWWHYISRKFMISAFDPDNIHLQCKTCNKPAYRWWKDWNILEYRPRLIQKIWIWKVTKLENDKNIIKDWKFDELESLIKEYKHKNKQLLQNKKLDCKHEM